MAKAKATTTRITAQDVMHSLQRDTKLCDVVKYLYERGFVITSIKLVPIKKKPVKKKRRVKA
jgi:hypothetical protein